MSRTATNDAMRTRALGNTKKPGVTLIELTVVIFVVLSLMGTTMYFAGNLGEWRKGKEAAAVLREVYSAQRLYLSDHPREAVASLVASDLVPYLPSGVSSIPSVEDLDGNTLTVNVAVSPPVLESGGGDVYDPSGSSDDSLWDVGE